MKTCSQMYFAGLQSTLYAWYVVHCKYEPSVSHQPLNPFQWRRQGGTGSTCPPKFSKVPFLVAKCPSDNVSNFGWDRKKFYFWKKIICPNKIFLFFKKIIIFPEKIRCPFLSKSAPRNRGPPTFWCFLRHWSFFFYFRLIEWHVYSQQIIFFYAGQQWIAPRLNICYLLYIFLLLFTRWKLSVLPWLCVWILALILQMSSKHPHVLVRSVGWVCLQ